MAEAFKIYEALKAKEGVMDYSDLISNTLKLFRERPSVLNNIKNNFSMSLLMNFRIPILHRMKWQFY